MFVEFLNNYLTYRYGKVDKSGKFSVEIGANREISVETLSRQARYIFLSDGMMRVSTLTETLESFGCHLNLEIIYIFVMDRNVRKCHGGVLAWQSLCSQFDQKRMLESGSFLTLSCLLTGLFLQAFILFNFYQSMTPQYMECGGIHIPTG